MIPPEEWARKGVEIIDSMLNVISKYINYPQLNQIVKTEKTHFMISNLYPWPSAVSGILPRSIFLHTDDSTLSHYK